MVATGTYRFASTFAMTSAQNGQGWIAQSGASPVFVGSVNPTSGWTATGGGICPSCMKATVPAGTTSRALWINGKRYVRAQAPGASLGTWTANSTGFAGTNTMYTWADSSGVEIRGEGAWIDYRSPVSSITSSQITAAQPFWGAQLNGEGGSFFNHLNWVENSLNLLTQAGMYYLDIAGLDGPANTIYVWFRPSDSPSTAVVDVPYTQVIMSVTGASNVSFTRIAFRYGTWNYQAGDGVMPIQGLYLMTTQPGSLSGWIAEHKYTGGGANMGGQTMPAQVQVVGSTGVTFSGCTFEGASVGLSLQTGTSASSVSGNKFFGNSGAGLIVGSSMQTADTSSASSAYVHDISVSNNLFVQNGEDYWGAPDIQAGYVRNVSFTNNTIYNSAYDGFMIGGFLGSGCSPTDFNFSSFGNITISNNLIRGVMHRTIASGGNIYVTGYTAPGSSYTVNANVVDNSCAGPSQVLALDTCTSYSTWTNNVAMVSGTAACLLGIQVTPYAGLSNSITSTYSDTSTACSGDTYDPSNTFATPTNATSIYSSTAPVPTILANAGSTLMDPDVSHGIVPTVSSGSTAAALTDAQFCNAAGIQWICTAATCSATFPLGVTRAVSSVVVEYEWGSDVPSQRVGYTIGVGSDPTCATSTNVVTVDSSGTFNGYYAEWADYFAISPAVSGNTVCLSKANTGGFAASEIVVNGK